MTPIAPTTPLSVTLEAQEWNVVIAALTEAPYKVVHALIQSMGGQLQAQAQQAQQAQQTEAHGTANGLDEALAA